MSTGRVTLPLSGDTVPRLEVLLPEVVGVGLLATLQRSPLGLVLEQTHSLSVLRVNQYISPLCKTLRAISYIRCISGETVVNASRHDHKIVLVKLDAHPIVILAPDIKVSAAINDIADLLVLVQVLVEERLDFVLVVGQGGGRNGDLVAILVVALFCHGVDVAEGFVVEVHDAQVG